MIFEKIVILFGLMICYFLNGSNIFEITTSFKPDFMVIFVTFFALRKGPMYGLWIGFFGGLLTDAGLGGETGADGKVYYMIGLHSLVFGIMGYSIGKFARNAYSENYISITLYNLLFAVIARISIYLLFGIFFHSNMNYSIVTTSVYNAAIAPLVFTIFTFLYKMEQDESAS